MTDWPVHGTISGPIVMIGFGSIGKGALPLIERHFEFDHKRARRDRPRRRGSRDRGRPRLSNSSSPAVTKENYRDLLVPLLTRGGGQGFCVNLSVDTSSLAIMELCREIGALYIDTVVEPWLGFYFDKNLGPEERSNYALRETVLASRRKNPGGTTAISCCGANPGMVSWFVKQALVNLAADLGDTAPEPKTRAEWGALAQRLGVKGIHIAERDTQRAKDPKPRGTCSSTPGRSKASSRKACSRPNSAGARMKTGCRRTAAPTSSAAAPRSICCSPAPTPACAAGPRPRARNMASSSPITRRSRSPIITPCATTRARRSIARPAITPITLPTTRCCRCTKCSAPAGKVQEKNHILTEHEIVDGIDELGVLLFGHAKGAYWYGSQLSVEETRQLCALPERHRHAGHRRRCWRAWSMRWKIRTKAFWKPTRWTTGAASKSRRPISGRWSASIPTGRRCTGRPGFFPEDIDESDPWQFRNILVR